MTRPLKNALWLLLVVGLTQARALAQLVTGVDSVGITVTDMDRALAFYTNVLPFAKISDFEVTGDEFERQVGVFGARARIVRLQLGDEFFELTDYLVPEGRTVPVDSRSNDQWFQHIAIIVSDMDKAYAHLRAHNVQHASTGPQTIPAWNKDAAGIRAFYFRDPDGHTLEILWFPPGKGAKKWLETDRLFLGIDHTAIVVSDTDSSLKFYRDVLGLKVAGESENYGPEQERLNNVFGARLRITSLRGSRGPAIEFLEYLAPRDGRAYPADSRANDAWHWTTRLIAPDAKHAATILAASKARFISPGYISDSATIRDPDGHVLQIAE